MKYIVGVLIIALCLYLLGQSAFAYKAMPDATPEDKQIGDILLFWFVVAIVIMPIAFSLGKKYG